MDNLHPHHRGAKRSLQIVAAALAAAAMLALLVFPSYVIMSEDSSGRESVQMLPLLSVVGGRHIFILALPLVLTVAPLIPRHRQWQLISVVSTVLLVLFAVISALSVGVYYLPAAVAAVAAAALPPGGRKPRAPR